MFSDERPWLQGGYLLTYTGGGGLDTVSSNAILLTHVSRQEAGQSVGVRMPSD